MPDSNFFYILFYTIHDVLRAEKILKEHGLGHELVPVPRNLSSDCGMCVKLPGDIEKVFFLLNKIDISGYYTGDGKECKEVRSE